ncbi:hypothetical protein F542_4040 [Bibersteinia trehalosi USDA-ARS-USMARC-188]|uniref:Uncharacterized protein n=3 Tax=Bibersteinia trehalosi TaxID=47735 RepID=W0RCE7_BIBTR|nr:hypothetical protein WQG_18540 [Bibersteinia trehalosi USDA-ARS-USMARC-192]AHG81121.1 hypothetical protein F542_4040 [Bibersteinia trehalosi USDA-ARS-USMARC-188]AHG83332.1 hypothetical protein F543_4690 [Bibersteinia trehalosi USDA-ARS-USMARC-189]AHG87063.1 hypothetical protein F544_18340 [Bibersteinia trehalosi USDA-ARS-USMARC-190]
MNIKQLGSAHSNFPLIKLAWNYTLKQAWAKGNKRCIFAEKLQKHTACGE